MGGGGGGGGWWGGRFVGGEGQRRSRTKKEKKCSLSLFRSQSFFSLFSFSLSLFSHLHQNEDVERVVVLAERLGDEAC